MDLGLRDADKSVASWLSVICCTGSVLLLCLCPLRGGIRGCTFVLRKDTPALCLQRACFSARSPRLFHGFWRHAPTLLICFNPASPSRAEAGVDPYLLKPSTKAPGFTHHFTCLVHEAGHWRNQVERGMVHYSTRASKC